MNLDQLYMKFEKGQQLITVKGPQASANELISANKMSTHLERGELCYIIQCKSMKGLHIKVKMRNPAR